jgi:tetratricopeptide (TPR) repeat protein
MASEDLSAEAWLARGSEAYQNHRFEEAAEYCEKAVSIEPSSVQAQLALGATRFTLYLRGSFPPPPDFPIAGDVYPRDELSAFREREKAMRAEQNSTNWPVAENSLKRANELDPQNTLVVEYLCSLYFYWKDLVNEQNDRVDEAKQWLERLAELDPENKYANSHCGMILMMKAHRLLPHYGQLPPVPETDLLSLRAEVGPWLEEARRHLARALALHGEQTAASHFLDEVTSMQAYLADPDMTARRLREELEVRFREHWQTRETRDENAVPPGHAETISFQLSPEAIAEDMARPFPPNPWRIPMRQARESQRVVGKV